MMNVNEVKIKQLEIENAALKRALNRTMKQLDKTVEHDNFIQQTMDQSFEFGDIKPELLKPQAS